MGRASRKGRCRGSGGSGRRGEGRSSGVEEDTGDRDGDEDEDKGDREGEGGRG